MNILLSCELLRPPLTGIGNYVDALCHGLAHSARINSLICFARPETDEVASASSLNVSPLAARMRRAVRAVPGAYPLRNLVRQIQFRHRVRALAPRTIYHEPSYILKPFDGCCVTTVHDLSHLHYPDFHPRERVRFLDRQLPRSLERATHIITDCEFVRAELINLLGVAPQRVTAIHLGVSEQYHPRGQAETRAVLQKYGLIHQSYLLAVATLEPRKNFAGLVRNYLRLPDALRKRIPLVIVGGTGWRTGKLQKMLDHLQSLGQLCQLGYVHAQELPLIYAGAKAFAFPAFYEGFGLPPLEAMASGVPVLTSENSAMSEVIGESAAFLVAPDNDDSLYAGLEQLLCDEAAARLKVQQGLLRAQNLGWSRCIEKTIDLYQQVAS